VSLELPPTEILRALGGAPLILYWDVARALQHFPGSTMSSWWRTVAHNASVGGNAESQHLIGLAIDVAPKVSIDAFRKKLPRPYTLIDEGDHLHVQMFPASLVAPYVRVLRR